MNLARLFQDKLDSKEIVILDGGTGTEVARRGITIHGNRSWSANANIAFPDLVRDIHEDYIHAGAQIITTNTFSTKRSNLAVDGLSEKIEEINNQSVKLAMEARENCGTEKTVLIAGSVGAWVTSFPSYEEALEVYREQVHILAEAGVDIIVLEMFFKTVDLKAALEAATETGLPIWVGLSCEIHDGQIYLGLMRKHWDETIADAASICSSSNVKSISIMHSPPEVTADALRELRKLTPLPLGAYSHGGSIEDQRGVAPKAGSDGQSLSGTDPENYVGYAREWVACGATIIGGCCGTTPDHIKALSNSDLSS